MVDLVDAFRLVWDLWKENMALIVGVTTFIFTVSIIGRFPLASTV